LKWDPRPSSLSTWMVPPCMSARRREIASPSPVPRRRARSSLVCFVLLKQERALLGADARPRVADAQARKASLVTDVDDDLTGLGET